MKYVTTEEIKIFSVVFLFMTSNHMKYKGINSGDGLEKLMARLHNLKKSL